MTIRQNLYFTSLLGAIAGFAAWAVGVWIPVTLRFQQKDYWKASAADAILVSLLICALCLLYADRQSGRGLSFWRMVGGTLGGVASGSMSVLLPWLARQYWLHGAFTWHIPLLTWLTLSTCVGATLGVLLHGLDLQRILLSMAGGAVGGALGAALLLGLGESIPYLADATGLMLVGLGIAFGSTQAISMARKARIELQESGEEGMPASRPPGQTQWEILRNDIYVFGGSPDDHNGARHIRLPGQHTDAPLALIENSRGSLWVVVHEQNRDPDGRPVYDVSIQRGRNGTRETIEVRRKMELQDDDEVRMGTASFRISISGRRKARSRTPWMAVLFALTCWCGFTSSGVAQSRTPFNRAQFKAAEVRLCQVAPGSEQPAFQIEANIVDPQGHPLPIPVIDPERVKTQISVVEDEHPLTPNSVVDVAQELREDPSSARRRRYAILLMDVSGSMVKPAADGRSKFEAMKEACRRFIEDLVEGVDYVAIIPFESHSVIKGVTNAPFLSRRADVEAKIDGIHVPRGNTGLFSAMYAAIQRLERVRKREKAAGHTNLQCFLVVMTDGHNDVGNSGDDLGLLPDAAWEVVLQAAKQAGNQIITVGFGKDAYINATVQKKDKDAYINEPVLRNLAWPSESNYFRAKKTSDLTRVFRTARLLQLERLTVTFLPRESLRGKLTRPHNFSLRWKRDAQSDVITGDFQWTPLPRGLTPFEGVLSAAVRKSVGATRQSSSLDWLMTYCAIVAGYGCMFYGLWYRLPKRMWAASDDARTLRARALSAFAWGDPGKDGKSGRRAPR